LGVLEGLQLSKGETPVPDDLIRLLDAELSLSGNQLVLDLGSGAGGLSSKLAHLVFSVDSVDCVAPNFTATLPANVNTRVQRVESFSFPVEHYDLIVSLEAFHLFPHQSHLLRRCLAALKPRGVIAVVWVEFFWEADLFVPIVQAFRRIGIDWGDSRNLAAMDLSSIVGGIAVSVRQCVVHQSCSVEQIAEYLTTVSKAQGLSPEVKLLLFKELRRGFLAAVGAPWLTGESRYIVHFVTKRAWCESLSDRAERT
jgi:2-polyprenyl-3-methyl-5-hydroxy-6-metoxy-1,4-benzoquinol methylase